MAKNKKPKLILLDHEPHGENALQVYESLKREIKGQDKALLKIINSIEKLDADFHFPNKPVYSALLLGGSGVGKTSIAKALAKHFFGDPLAYTFIAGNQLIEKHQGSQIFGSPPGYIGYGEAPLLAQANIDRWAIKARHSMSGSISALENAEIALKKLETETFRLLKNKVYTTPSKITVDEMNKIDARLAELTVLRFQLLNKMDALSRVVTEIKFKGPKSIILIDEVEKASPTIYKQFMEMLDEGRASMANGEITNFSETIFLFTSNIGSGDIADLVSGRKGIGFDLGSDDDNSNRDQQIYKNVMRAAEEYFAAEFLPRINDIIVFRPLTYGALLDIFDKEIVKFEHSYLAQYHIYLVVSEEVKRLIVNEATDRPQNGARLLQHKIDRKLVEYLARLKNRGEIVPGDVIHIKLAPDGRTIQFYKEDPDP